MNLRIAPKLFPSRHFNRSPFTLLPTITRQKTTNSSDSPPTIVDLVGKIAEMMGVETIYSPHPRSRANLLKYLPEKQTDLPARTMKDSYLIALIPFSSSTKLRNKYTTALGSVRVGRLLENMDTFSVMAALKYLYNPKIPKGNPVPQTLVTAFVDQIDLADYTANLETDIRFSGHVTWAGRSSMEVVVWVEQQKDDNWQRITKALFVIAARDPTYRTSAFVNPLSPGSDIEKRIFAEGEKRKSNRKLVEQQHVYKVLPNKEEQKIVHDLYLKTKSKEVESSVLPPGGAWMKDCKISNTIFTQPDNRNLHNTVFGGFIMKEAAELSWALAFRFSKSRPKFKSISDIKFNKAIAVNALIQMHAYVVYTSSKLIQVAVFVEAYTLQTGSISATNNFHFTFKVSEIVKEVYPTTYHEAMMYVDGRRHFLEVMQHKRQETSLLNEEGLINKDK